MTVNDGWINAFRLVDDDTLRPPDATTAAVAAFFGKNPEEWRQTTPRDALREMDTWGIDRALLTCSQASQHREGGLEFTLAQGMEACTGAEGRLRLVYQLDDVSSPADVASLVSEVARKAEVAAIGVFPSLLGCDLNDRRLYPVYAACVHAGLPVRINVGVPGPRWPSRHQHPLLLEDLLLDFPDLVIIAAHMGHPWEKLLIRLMMKFDHLYLMSSGYLPKYIDPDVIRFMNSSKGRGRVAFASDYPVISIERALKEARLLPLDEEAQAAFLGGTLDSVVAWG